MLLKIKPHGPEEKPSHSCKVVMAMSYGLTMMDYSTKYDAWNVADTDKNNATAIDNKNMIGWVYSDEIFWQIVNARREAGDEI